MKSVKKQPLIRFRGFTDDWEQRKLGEIASFFKGNGYSKKDLMKDGTPIILYGRLYTNYEFEINEVNTFVCPEEGSVYSKGNEVIIPASGETAEDIARASAVNISGIILGGDLNIIRPFEYMDSLFLALNFSCGNSKKQLSRRAQGKSVVHIQNSDIREITIFYPVFLEQNIISKIFINLDRLITLHKRKYYLININRII